MIERRYAQIRKQSFPIFHLGKDLGEPYIFPAWKFDMPNWWLVKLGLR